MNCPHGRGEFETCYERACVQNVFTPHDGPVVRVTKLLCDDCGHGVGRRRSDAYGGGLSARTIRDFQTKHEGHSRYWKMVEVDTLTVRMGRGDVPVVVDSDEKNVSLTKTHT